MISEITPFNVAKYIVVHPTGEYTFEDVALITREYFSACVITGLNPLMVIAQMLHETGNLTSFWSQRPRRNPAGIGVTGEKSNLEIISNDWQYDPSIKYWRYGKSFKNWQDAVTAHVGRLLVYSVKNPTKDQKRYMDFARNVREVPKQYRGIVRVWEDLNGKWAVPGKTYAQNIRTLATRIELYCKDTHSNTKS